MKKKIIGFTLAAFIVFGFSVAIYANPGEGGGPPVDPMSPFSASITLFTELSTY